MTDRKPEAEPIRSRFAGDPDMAELVEFFVEQAPGRVEAISQTFEQGAFDRLKALAHQLKGAGGSYGFPQISEAAASLEHAASSPENLDAIEREIGRLTDLCNRVAR